MPSVINDRVILDESDLNILEMALDQRVYPKTIEDLNAWIDLVDENNYNSPEERLLKAMAKQMRIDPSNPPEPAYSTVILPPIPRTLCHPFHGHPATDSTVILPLIPR